MTGSKLPVLGSFFLRISMATPARRTITSKQVRDANRAYLSYADDVRSALQDLHTHVEFSIEPMVMLNVTVATYDDIDRYKSYHLRNHGSERADVVKRATYFMKWTTKLRPVMFVRGKVSSAEDMALMANESLAVAWALELIGEEIKREIRLSPKAEFDLLYDLHFREMGDGALLAVVQMITDLARSGKPNDIVLFSID